MTFAPLAHSSAFLALAAVAPPPRRIRDRRAPAPAGNRAGAANSGGRGTVIPAWIVVSWYRDLARAREVATRMAIHAEPVVERAVVNGAALLCLGFLVMIGGIWLARRVS